MKTFAIGDIHGAYKALLQCLERSGFDKKNDRLISLGDVADGWPYVYECVEELLSIENMIPVTGNHDVWLYEYLKFGSLKSEHVQQGGQASIDSYIEHGQNNADRHLREFFEKQTPYFLDDNNRLFIHGGINWKVPIDEQQLSDIMWDRHMYQTALYWDAYALCHPTDPKNWFKDYKEIFIGHTSTTYAMDYRYPGTTEPRHVCNLWNLDQGAGWEGKLTIMNVDTKEYFQSDEVGELYPDIKNARK